MTVYLQRVEILSSSICTCIETADQKIPRDIVIFFKLFVGDSDPHLREVTCSNYTGVLFTCR